MKADTPAWARWEAYVQHLLGLDSTIASGGKWYDISDGVDRDRYGSSFQLIIDAKATEKGSYSVTRKFMAQWRLKAEMMGKRFAVPIRFVSPHGMNDDYVVLGLDDFAELLEMARKGEEQ